KAVGFARRPLGVAQAAPGLARGVPGKTKTAVDKSRSALNHPRKLMDRDQLNVTEMGSTVSNYMAKNKTLWGGVKAITETVADVDATLDAIGKKDAAQQSPTGGAADQKGSVRHDFEDQIILIA